MVQLISEEFIAIEDLVMVNGAADIDEVLDFIIALMPTLYHMTLVKREYEGYTLYHPSQTQHRELLLLLSPVCTFIILGRKLMAKCICSFLVCTCVILLWHY